MDIDIEDLLPFGPPSPRPKRYQGQINRLLRPETGDEEVAKVARGLKKPQYLLRLLRESPPELQRRIIPCVDPELLRMALIFLRPGEAFRLMDSEPPFVLPFKFLAKPEQLPIWMKHGFPSHKKIKQVPKDRHRLAELKRLARKWFYWVTLLEPWLAERFLRVIPPRYFKIAFEQNHRMRGCEAIRQLLTEYYGGGKN